MSCIFHIAVEPSVVIFSISGKINHDDTITELVDALTIQLEQGQKKFLLQISDLTYITSSGLNLFIRILTRVRNAGGDLVLVGLQGSVKKLFEISKLIEIFTVCSSLEEGQAKLIQQKA